METYLFSDQGPLEQNEDCVLVVEDKKRSALALMAADGLGGHGDGATASRLAARIIGEGFLQDPTLEEEALAGLFRQAHQAILREQRPGHRMKSTAAAVFLLEGRGVAVHIGDSRIYRFAGGKLRWQSLDHSVPQLAVWAGEIGPEGIRSHPDRNRLYRALGGDSCEPQVSPLGPIETGEALLVCTDGFWEPVTEERMEEVLRVAASPRTWLETLRREALEQGGWRDNASAAASI